MKHADCLVKLQLRGWTAASGKMDGSECLRGSRGLEV